MTNNKSQNPQTSFHKFRIKLTIFIKLFVFIHNAIWSSALCQPIKISHYHIKQPIFKIVLCCKSIWLMFILCISLFFYGCNNESKTIKPKNHDNIDAKNKYDTEIFNMDIVITNKGIVTQKIKAGHVMQTKIKYSNLMRSVIDSGLNVIFYKQGKISGDLVSDKGIMDDKKGVFTALGNVIFKSPSGYRVYTEELKWDRKKARIFTDKYVLSVSDQNDTLIGENGMDANQDFTDIIIKSAKGRKKVDKKN